MSQERQYTAADIVVLEGLAAVRKRPGMYIGTTSVRGLRHMLLEVVERAVQEVPAGEGRVDVALLPGDGVRVADNGSGAMLVDGGFPDLEVLYVPGSRWSVVPVAAVNALAGRMTVEVRRDGVVWSREYAQGRALTPVTGSGPTAEAGTTFTVWPDAEIFETTEMPFDSLADRLRELAFLNPGMQISLTDLRGGAEAGSVRFRAPGGVEDFVAHLDAEAGAAATPYGASDIVGFELADPEMTGTMAVAFRWRDSGEARIRSFANWWATDSGGTHVAGLGDGIAAALNAFARERGLLTGTDPGFEAHQTFAGLTAVIAVTSGELYLEGSARDRLGTPMVRGRVAEAVGEHLGGWLSAHPGQGEAVVRWLLRSRHGG